MHVSAELSAYLDQEIAPAEQARVSAHLEGCGRCAKQLADLRATATLMAALPALRPSRSLVPSLTTRWNWLRPVRSLSTVASGAFVMLFLITAVAQSGSNLGGGPPMPFGGAAAQPAAATIGDAGARGAAPAELKVATESPAIAAAPAAPDATAAPAPETQQERAAAGTPSTAFSTAEDAAARERDAVRTNLGQAAPPPSPLIWLGLSLIAAIVAFTAHWRLRAA